MCALRRRRRAPPLSGGAGEERAERATNGGEGEGCGTPDCPEWSREARGGGGGGRCGEPHEAGGSHCTAPLAEFQ